MLRYKEISCIERNRERAQEFWIHFNVFYIVITKYKEISCKERRGREKKRERNRERALEFWIHFNVFCVVIAKYNEISWRVRRMVGGKK